MVNNVSFPPERHIRLGFDWSKNIAMSDRTDRFVPIPDARPNDTPWCAMTWPPQTTHLAGEIVDLDACVPDRDAEPLFRALNDDAVWRHLRGRPETPTECRQTLAQWQADGRFVWVLRLRRTYAGLPAGTVIGTSSYLEVAPADARVEIGATAYARAVWGSKVNPDAKHQLLSYAFDELGAGRVQFKTDVRNVRSQQAIARLGARYEGTLRRSMRRNDGTVRDSVFFSIIAEEWPSIRADLIARITAPEPPR